MELYKAITQRRDTRHFKKSPVPDDVIDRALTAAHHAPSVGLSQPWRFVFVENLDTKKRIHKNFIEQRNKAESKAKKAPNISADKNSLHRNLKLEGILEAPIGMVVFCEAESENHYTIGTTSERSTFSWSVACAIQNFWLSLTADGYSMGWVSILDYPALNEDLQVPSHWEALGYFCIGKPSDDYEGKPMLQTKGWKNPDKKPTVIHFK